MTVQDVEVAQKVWGKNIASLKGKNTWRNLNVVARDQVKIPLGLIKFHKKVFLTCDIFFVNKISFFLTLSQNIYFTEVNHLTINIDGKPLCQYHGTGLKVSLFIKKLRNTE